MRAVSLTRSIVLEQMGQPSGAAMGTGLRAWRMQESCAPRLAQRREQGKAQSMGPDQHQAHGPQDITTGIGCFRSHADPSSNAFDNQVTTAWEQKLEIVWSDIAAAMTCDETPGQFFHPRFRGVNGCALGMVLGTDV